MVTPMTQKQSRVLWLVESDSDDDDDDEEEEEEEEEEESGMAREFSRRVVSTSRRGSTCTCSRGSSPHVDA